MRVNTSSLTSLIVCISIVLVEASFAKCRQATTSAFVQSQLTSETDGVEVGVPVAAQT